jgi:hypothetical protein
MANAFAVGIAAFVDHARVVDEEAVHGAPISTRACRTPDTSVPPAM